MNASRRSFIAGLAGFLAAPAIVRASSLMAVKSWLSDGVALRSMAHPMNGDFSTENLRFRAYERFEIGAWDERAMWGTAPFDLNPASVVTLTYDTETGLVS